MQCNLISDNMMEALYGEIDQATRGQVEAHLAACATCRSEWEGLRRVRRDLDAWRLPDLGSLPWRAPRTRNWLQGLAAAATIILSIGASVGLARPSVRYDGHGTNISFGQAADSEIRTLEDRLATQEARHADEIRALQATLARPALEEEALAEAGGLTEAKRLIRASELRQEQRLAVQLADWHERSETQRRYDLARVAASLSYLEGQNGQHMARTTELVGYMLDASHNGQLR